MRDSQPHRELAAHHRHETQLPCRLDQPVRGDGSDPASLRLLDSGLPCAGWYARPPSGVNGGAIPEDGIRKGRKDCYGDGFRARFPSHRGHNREATSRSSWRVRSGLKSCWCAARSRNLLTAKNLQGFARNLTCLNARASVVCFQKTKWRFR